MRSILGYPKFDLSVFLTWNVKFRIYVKSVTLCFVQISVLIAFEANIRGDPFRNLNYHSLFTEVLEE